MEATSGALSPERKCGSVSGVSAKSEWSGNLDIHVYRSPVGAMEAVLRALQAAVETLRAVLRALSAVPKAFKMALTALNAVTGALKAVIRTVRRCNKP